MMHNHANPSLMRRQILSFALCLPWEKNTQQGERDDPLGITKRKDITVAPSISPCKKKIKKTLEFHWRIA